jgi:DNA-binding transcriptional LysR family regulator
MLEGKESSSAELELRHLRYFLVTAEELNFGRAAERLNIAQPGLSQQIKSLERIVGTALFDRTRRAVQLTLAGELFAAEARATLAHAERALGVAQTAGRGEVGSIAIGYLGSAAYTGMLTKVLSTFQKNYPKVELQLHAMEMSLQLEHLSLGKLDIGFIRPPVPLPIGVATMPILQETLCLALPDSHPLASHETVPLSGMSDDIFITPFHAPNVSFHKHTTTACQAAGFLAKLGPQGKDFMTIVGMVSIGVGVAIVPQSVSCIQLPGVRYKAIAGPPIRAELAVAFRRSEPSAAARAFVQHARKFSLLRRIGTPEPAQGHAERSYVSCPTT